jgi:hypothetical protein
MAAILPKSEAFYPITGIFGLSCTGFILETGFYPRFVMGGIKSVGIGSKRAKAGISA